MRHMGGADSRHGHGAQAYTGEERDRAREAAARSRERADERVAGHADRRSESSTSSDATTADGEQHHVCVCVCGFATRKKRGRNACKHDSIGKGHALHTGGTGSKTLGKRGQKEAQGEVQQEPRRKGARTLTHTARKPSLARHTPPHPHNTTHDNRSRTAPSKRRRRRRSFHTKTFLMRVLCTSRVSCPIVMSE